MKEILYLSLEKSLFLNKIHLNILNSFEDNKIQNKPFKPLLNNNTRVKYFNFFSQFIIFFFRVLKESNNNSYFKANNRIVSIYQTLKDLIDLKIKEDNYLELSNKSLKKNKGLINKRLNKFRFNNLINCSNSDSKEEEKNETNSISSLSSRNSNISSRESINSNESLLDSSSSNNSSESEILESSNKEILKKIQEINKSKDSLSLKIKDSLIDLLISLFKQKTDLNIFDSSINSFFAIVNIRTKDKSFKGSLELSQDYSKFIYYTQLIVIEFAFK